MPQISVMIHNANTLKCVQKSLSCLLLQNFRFAVDIWIINKTRNKQIKKLVDVFNRVMHNIKYATSENKIRLDYDYFFVLDESVLLRENSLNVALSYLLREKNVGVAFKVFKLTKNETKKLDDICCSDLDNILTVMDLGKHNQDIMKETREIDLFGFAKDTCTQFKFSSLKEKFKKIKVINPHMLCFKFHKGE